MAVNLLLFVCVLACTVQAIRPKPVELLQQEITKKAAADCSTCTAPNQFCNLASWTGVCKDCPVCGIDHFCDGRGYCQRCPGVYLKPTQACERLTSTDLQSPGTYVEDKAVRLVFSTVGDDLFYLSAEPNNTGSIPTPFNVSSFTNGTIPPMLPLGVAALPAHLSTVPSLHVIEEITAGSGNYRVRFNDSLGGFLFVIPPPDEDSTVLLDIKTMGVSQILRDFAGFTTFNVEHSASFSWRFRIGSEDNAKYVAWCAQSTCGQGVPALRLVSSMFCGSLTSSGIRCDVMITN